MTTLQSIIEDAFENRSEITPSTVSSEIKNAVNETMEGLNHGIHRVASRLGNSQDWETHQWIKKAVLLSFRIEDNIKIDSGYTSLDGSRTFPVATAYVPANTTSKKNTGFLLFAFSLLDF